MEEHTNSRSEQEDSQDEDEVVNQHNSSESMDYEDSQESLWTSQSTSSTIFDSNRQDNRLNGTSSGGKIYLILFSVG